MIIGLPKEIKNNENRVGLTPGGVNELVNNGHSVIVEKHAGDGSGFTDREYLEAGAKVVDTSKEVFDVSDIIVKVKEPLAQEYDLLKKGQKLFTYLHLAPNAELTEVLLKKEITAIAYETVQLEDRSLPLLLPMSEVAGKMAVQVGADMLQKYRGGMGIILGGVSGVAPAEVVIVGGGIVGTNAAKVALGMGARVTVLDISKNRLVYLDDIFGGKVTTLICNNNNVTEMTKKADLLIGAVLVAGSSAPKIVKESMVKNMKKGSVIVDVAIDQGGSIETIDRVTTHDNPCYEKHGVIHYSVANMPGAVPRTATIALESATLPYLLKLVNKGVEKALAEDPSLLKGLNTYKGKVTCLPVASSLNLQYTDAKILLK